MNSISNSVAVSRVVTKGHQKRDHEVVEVTSKREGDGREGHLG